MTSKDTKRLTAAERRRAAEETLAAKRLAFEQERSSRWTELWAKALRLQALITQDSNMEERFRGDTYWGESFRLDAVKESFSIERKEITEKSLSYENAADCRSLVTGAITLLLDYCAEVERARLAEIEKRRLQDEALAKLSIEEIRALGFDPARVSRHAIEIRDSTPIGDR